MDRFQTIITTACMLSITIGLCNALKPTAIFEKQIRFLISMIFVLCISAPILQLRKGTISFFVPKYNMQIQSAELTEQVHQSILDKTAEQINAALQELLRRNGIICTKLDVRVHIDEGQRIYISEVSAECDQPDHACEILRASLGEEVILHVSQMDQ